MVKVDEMDEISEEEMTERLCKFCALKPLKLQCAAQVKIAEAFSEKKKVRT